MPPAASHNAASNSPNFFSKKAWVLASRRFHVDRLAAQYCDPQPMLSGNRWVVTSGHLATLPLLEPVIAQSMTPLWAAGTTSCEGMVIGVPPAPVTNAASPLL